MFAAVLAACDALSVFDPQTAALCRAHDGEVLQFKWHGAWHALPTKRHMSPAEDAAWRARLRLPPRVESPNPFQWQAWPIAAVAPLGGAWLVGTDMGEWGGDLFLVREGAAPLYVVRGNVRALLPAPDGVVVVSGLAHLGADDGRYRLVSMTAAGPIVGEPHALPGAPIDIARDGAVTFIAGGFSERAHARTWAVAFVDGRPEPAQVRSPCPRRAR